MGKKPKYYSPTFNDTKGKSSIDFQIKHYVRYFYNASFGSKESLTARKKQVDCFDPLRQEYKEGAVGFQFFDTINFTFNNHLISKNKYHNKIYIFGSKIIKEDKKLYLENKIDIRNKNIYLLENGDTLITPVTVLIWDQGIDAIYLDNNCISIDTYKEKENYKQKIKSIFK